MSDLRALLYEPWCQTSQGESRLDLQHDRCPDCRQDLATRLPECVPPGLEWSGERLPGSRIYGWMLFDSTRGDEKWHRITDEQAELLFIGKDVLLIAECGWVLDYSLDGWSVFGWGIEEDESKSGGHHKTATDALAAALHRLADFREAEKA